MKTRTRALVFGVVAFSSLVACSQGETSADPASHAVESMATPTGSAQPVPAEYQTGEKRFNALCARCHGMAGIGTNVGPPLVHKIYEPSHHADFAFWRAVMQGVRPHHWEFGPMPQIPEATSDDVTQIIPYVRWVQRQAGIY